MIYKIILLVFLLVISAYADKKEEKKENYGTVIGIDLGTTYSWYLLSDYIIKILKF